MLKVSLRSKPTSKLLTRDLVVLSFEIVKIWQRNHKDCIFCWFLFTANYSYLIFKSIHAFLYHVLRFIQFKITQPPMIGQSSQKTPVLQNCPMAIELLISKAFLKSLWVRGRLWRVQLDLMWSLLSEVRTSCPMVFSLVRTWGPYNSIVLIVNRNYRNIQCDSCHDISPMLPETSYSYQYKGNSQEIDISPIFQTVAPAMFLYKKILILVDEYRTPSKLIFQGKLISFIKRICIMNCISM